MTIRTKLFGDVFVDEDKLIHFTNGIIGFPDLKMFLLIHDAERETQGGIRWMQSIEEPNFAIPVVDPLAIVNSYNPKIEDELLKVIDVKESSEILVLTTISIPEVVETMSINLMAPIIINVDNHLACQIITEGDYPVKYPVYYLLKAKEARKDGE